jgi:hypothetical protein
LRMANVLSCESFGVRVRRGCLERISPRTTKRGREAKRRGGTPLRRQEPAERSRPASAHRVPGDARERLMNRAVLDFLLGP